MATSFDREKPTTSAYTAHRNGESPTTEKASKSALGATVSPPRTPQKDTSIRTGDGNTAVANRALRIKAAGNGPLLKDNVGVDHERGTEQDGTKHVFRDSHDLSIPARQITRDSLVENMLQSLDQFSLGQTSGGVFGEQTLQTEESKLYAAFEDDEVEHYSTYDTTTRTAAQGHGYSYSSDYDNPDMHTQASSQYTGRGRRSGSSSNFQPGPGRINSARIELPPLSSAAQRAAPTGQSRGLHSRSGRGSKSSSANSFDVGYARVGSTQRWGATQPVRPSSLDINHERPVMTDDYSAHNTNQYSAYDYEAAPTPTIPVGPRRVRPISPILPYVGTSSASSPQLERTRSNKSSKPVQKARADVVNGLGINYGLEDANRELPPLPAFIKEPAPAPSVGYNKSKDLPNPHEHQQPTKDRTGFFRRVFGSSRNNPVSASDGTSMRGSTASVETAGDHLGSNKTNHIANQMKSQPQGKEILPPPPHKETGHTLTKKPSSFFRRRKKSMSESAPPPMPIVPPLQLQAQPQYEDGPQLSPVSSLRKIMNPYLATPSKPEPSSATAEKSATQRSRRSHADDETRGFSPGYTPDKSATIRSIEVEPRKVVKATSPDTSINRDVSSSPAMGRNAKPLPTNSSDNDRASSPECRDERAKQVISPIPSAAAVARDRALVAEYERLYSKKAAQPVPLPNPSTEESVHTPSFTSSRKHLQDPAKEDEWIVVTPTKDKFAKDNRVWIEPTSSEENLPITNNLEMPLFKSTRSSGSTNTAYKSATSLPIVQVDGETMPEATQQPLLSAGEALEMLDEPEEMIESEEPSEAEKEKAQRIYDGNEDFIVKGKAAAWLGEQNIVSRKVLQAYMDIYDFTNLNILAALRVMCGRLVLKGESQQVDRILDAFSSRWCRCNPNHGFKISDVVHTICYSILLLNTDLHLADIESKMTRSQFVKNTMPTILRVIQDSAPETFERPSILPTRSQTLEQLPAASKDEPVAKEKRASVDIERPSWRGSMKPPKRTDSDGLENQKPTPLNYSTPQDDCGPLVKAPFHGTLRTWEVQVEIVLKDFYNSIRAERLPLSADRPSAPVSQTQSSLSVFTNGVLRRTPSVISKAPSEAQSYNRSRSSASNLGTGKWSNKNRSRARVYPNSTMASSRTSLDDGSSIWSPSQTSSTWSRYSLGKTQASMSVDSLGSSWQHGDYQQSIGFANALSQAIIREEVGGSGASVFSETSEQYGRVLPLLEDESLGLHGAPWAKEGIVKHKHHLESTDKKAKDRNWTEVFAVVEKGYLTLFSFSSKSMRNKTKSKTANAVVGGGNWQDNAENLGSFLLRQTIASALPPPGYSKARPHVWALSLPTGAVHLFQVGSPEIVREYVTTANYWSARLSTHPLVGGLSNIEHGWSDNIINNALVTAINDQHAIAPSRPSTSQARHSLQSSLRSSLDQGIGSNTFKAKLPGDKVTISDWNAPSQSMRASNLMEQDQLKTLTNYVQGIEEEFQKHNTLRSSMLLAYTPRSNNANKAMANWEKKSSYLLKEIVKFRTYIDTLQGAEAQKQKIYKEREERKAEMEAEMEFGDEDDDDADVTLRP